MSQERGTQKSRLLSFYNLDVPHFHYKGDRVSTLIPRGKTRGTARQQQPEQTKPSTTQETAYLAVPCLAFGSNDGIIWGRAALGSHIPLVVHNTHDLFQNPFSSHLSAFLSSCPRISLATKAPCNGFFRFPSSADFWHVGAGFHDPITLAVFCLRNQHHVDNVAEVSSSSGWSRLPFPTALGLLCNVGTFENTSLGGRSTLGKPLLRASSVLCNKFAL